MSSKPTDCTAVAGPAQVSAREALLADVLKALTGSDSLDSILHGCAQAVVDRLGAAFARIWTLNDGAQTLELRASAGQYTHLDGPHSRVQVGELKIGRIAAEGRPHLTNDVLGDERISDPEWASREGMVSFAGYPLVVGGCLVGVLAMFARHQLSAETLDALAAVADSMALALGRWRTEEQLRDEKRILENLHRLGTSIAGQLDLDRVVQTVTDAATELTSAEFGAFFYNVVNEQGESYMLYTLSGAPHEAFADFPLPRNTAVFDPTFRGEGVVRLDDVLGDPRYGREEPYHGMPPGHLPVRSYLAVPVVARSGEVLGGLFFGHAKTGVFSERDERVVEGIAGHAAVAIETARLYERERQAALALQKSLLPECLPEADGVVLASRYLPGSTHSEVGGDWYDALVLPDGRLMLSVGDVAGHDLHAAAIMGQIRTVVRAYALEGYGPAELILRLDGYATQAGPQQLTTMVQLSYDPSERIIDVSSAGHPPPLLVLPDGCTHFLELSPLPPVGCGAIAPGTTATATRVALPAGSTLLLFTDGLVERVDASLQDGLDQLRSVTAAAVGLDPEQLCDHLLKELAGDGRDDVALLVMRTL